MSRRKITRLTDSPEFERVYRQGTAFRGKLFSVHAFPNDSENVRFGLSVSRRIGNAVTRNKVRRRLREVFRSALPKVPAGMDLVVSARPAAADASFQGLEQEFARALRKIGGPIEGDKGPRR